MSDESEWDRCPTCTATRGERTKRHDDGCEIASLRAEVARLTEWVSKADGMANEVNILTAEVRASRALADRLAEALDAIYCGDDDCAAYECGIARAALREWEEARRG